VTSFAEASDIPGVRFSKDPAKCSGLMMMACRSAGIDIPRTSELQWFWGPRAQPGHEEHGGLVFLAGPDGTPKAPPVTRTRSGPPASGRICVWRTPVSDGRPMCR
jgi:hypothetical protein